MSAGPLRTERRTGDGRQRDTGRGPLGGGLRYAMSVPLAPRLADFCGNALQDGCFAVRAYKTGDGSVMADEPSVTRIASLLLGSVTAAHSALVELADRGWLYDRKSEELIAVHHQAAEFSAELYSLLGQRKKETVAAGEGFRKVIEAVHTMAGECERLSGLAAEQATIDARFQKITEGFRQPSDGNG